MSRWSKRASEAVPTHVVREFVSSVRREIRGLASEGPLDAELVASGLLSMWAAEWADEQEALDALGTAVLDALATRPDPDVLALLLAIGATADAPLGDIARRHADVLRRGVAEPIWSRAIGRPALVDAWISTDGLEDQSNIATVWAYERQPSHALVVMTDANFRGLIRQAFVAENPRHVRDEWVSMSGLPVRPLSEQALADRLGTGIEWYDRYLDPPVSEEAAELMPLLRARLRLLPAPRLIESPEVSEQARDAIVDAFVASPDGTSIVAADAARARSLAARFVDFACDYGAGDPMRWSPMAVEILMTDWLPRKAILDPDEVIALPRVLKAFVRYAAGRKGLREDVFAETIEAVDTLTNEYLEAMGDDTRAGPAKDIAQRMLQAGVDLTDADAVGRWIENYNRSLSRSDGR